MIGFTDPDSESRPSVAIQLVVFAVEVRDDRSKKTIPSQRKGKQELNNMIFPVLLLGWISMLAIIVPASSGEKISFIVSLELAFVFMMATLDTMIISPTRTVINTFQPTKFALDQ